MNLDYSIGIIGGGAVGLTYAALLSEQAHITVITRSRPQADEIQNTGIEFSQRSGGKHVFDGISASTNFESLQNCDAVIICVKSYDTEEVATKIALHLSDTAKVLTLQNGLQAFDTLKKFIGSSDRIFAGVTYIGASRTDNRSVTNGEMLRTVVDKRAGDLARILAKSKFQAELSGNINQVIWDKMVLNTGQNALSAITGLNFGEMFESQDCLSIADELTKELEQVGRVEGLFFNYSMLEKLKENWKGSSFLPSMWQDIHHGRKTEVDAINGSISRLGKKHNIYTPYNDLVTSLIHAIEVGSHSNPRLRD